jgi:hypothetical protein
MMGKKKADVYKDANAAVKGAKARGEPSVSFQLAKGGSSGGKWIQDAVKKPGALRSALGVKEGKTIPAKKLSAAAKAPGKMGQRARLAETLKGLRKK